MKKKYEKPQVCISFTDSSVSYKCLTKKYYYKTVSKQKVYPHNPIREEKIVTLPNYQ